MARLSDRPTKLDEEDEEQRRALVDQPKRNVPRQVRNTPFLESAVEDVRRAGSFFGGPARVRATRTAIPETGGDPIEQFPAPPVSFEPPRQRPFTLRDRAIPGFTGRTAKGDEIPLTQVGSAAPGAFGPFTGIRGAERARAAAARDIAQEEAERARERRIEQQLQEDANIRLSGDMTLTELADAASRRNLAVARLRDRRELQSAERIAAGEEQRRLREAQIEAGTEQAKLAAEADEAALEQANKDREFLLDVDRFGLDQAIFEQEASTAQTKAEREQVKEETVRKTQLLRDLGLPDDRIARLKTFVNTKDKNFSSISDNELQDAAILMDIRDAIQRQVPGLVLNTTEDVLKAVDSVDEEALAQAANFIARAPVVGGLFDASIGRIMRAIDDTDINIVDPNTGRQIADIDFADAFRTPPMKQLIMRIISEKGRDVTGLRRSQP